ncbi:MAG TPA: flavodoxin-dependent (E)-4-hydroxy-3-methylbut-2-enyl-diphosphate synthase, partial [Armatimonadota bacterium]
ELRVGGITLTSCPTCARCDIDFDPVIKQVKAELQPLDRALRAAGRSLRVAVMGCEVNGPGEARDADIGVAAGKHSATLIRQGEVVGKIPEAEIVSTLVREVKRLAGK